VLLLGLGVVACASARSTDRVAIPIDIPLRGHVVYPDGSPAVGAKVVAATICERDWAHFVSDTLTTDDGSFVIKSFDTSCGEIRFTAEKRDGFWLKTGNEVFYPRPNGTPPEIHLLGDVSPDPLTIQLDLRGGELELKVWDESAKRHIRAGLMIECPGAWCGAISIATGESGAAHMIFVPARRYQVSLNWYMCGSRTYFPETGPSITVDALEGQRREAVLTIDVPMIRAKPSYDNPQGVSCQL